MSKDYWGNGYAPEAGAEVLKFAFNQLQLEEVVSFTTRNNRNSQSVMQKLNMIDTKQNFLHPNVPDGDNLQEHVLYKITSHQWKIANPPAEQMPSE